MTDVPRFGPDGLPPASAACAPVPSRRQRRQIERASNALGQPVIAATAFRVEGTLPWYLFGVALGVGLLGGAVGALIGCAVGYGMARMVTRRRAAGVGFTTILAATTTQLYALKANFWSGRPAPGQPIGIWPLTDVPIEVRRKHLTVAVALDLGDRRRPQLESVSRKGADVLIANLAYRP